MNEANGGLWCFCWKAVSLSSRVAYGTLGASKLALVVHGLPYGAPLSKYQVGEFGRRPACTSGPREARRRFVNEVGAVHDEVRTRGRKYRLEAVVEHSGHVLGGHALSVLREGGAGIAVRHGLNAVGRDQEQSTFAVFRRWSTALYREGCRKHGGASRQ